MLLTYGFKWNWEASKSGFDSLLRRMDVPLIPTHSETSNNRHRSTMPSVPSSLLRLRYAMRQISPNWDSTNNSTSDLWDLVQRLQDLPAEVMILVFRHLDLGSLIFLAKLNPQFWVALCWLPEFVVVRTIFLSFIWRLEYYEQYKQRRRSPYIHYEQIFCPRNGLSKSERKSRSLNVPDSVYSCGLFTSRHDAPEAEFGLLCFLWELSTGQITLMSCAYIPVLIDVAATLDDQTACALRCLRLWGKCRAICIDESGQDWLALLVLQELALSILETEGVSNNLLGFARSLHILWRNLAAFAQRELHKWFLGYNSEEDLVRSMMAQGLRPIWPWVLGGWAHRKRNVLLDSHERQSI